MRRVYMSTNLNAGFLVSFIYNRLLKMTVE